MMQLNKKELKGFRDTLALWHIADFVLADELYQRNLRIKNKQGLIDGNNIMLEKLASGNSIGVLKSEDELKAEIESWEKSIKADRESYTKLKEEQDKDIKKGLELVNADLLSAIKAYLTDIYNDDAENGLYVALTDWFKKQGANDADIESVKVYVRALGMKKGSAKSKITNNKHNTIYSDNDIKSIFLGAICDEPTMRQMLPIHKFVSVIEKKVANK